MGNLEELRRRREASQLGGGPEAIKRQHEKGKLTARERIDLLVDPGSFTEIDPFVAWDTEPTAARMRALVSTPSDP